MSAYSKPAVSLPESHYIKDWPTLSLRDGTKATLIPFNDAQSAPDSLITVVMDLLNAEIEAGNTYPQDSKLDKEQFISYYFGYFVAILVQGEFTPENTDLSTLNFSKLFLGSFYVKPNYPGRSSHICNGGFLVSADARGKGVGTVMGENYIKIAPKLGFKSSIFNLVFVSNVASYKIWDRLGFKRVGTIPKAGYLKGLGYTDAYVYSYEFESEDALEGQKVE